MQEEGKVEPIFSPLVTDFLSNYDTTYGRATVTKCSTRPWGIPNKVFFPGNADTAWMALHRQASRSWDCGPNVTPCTLISSLIGPTIAQVLTTMGKTRLHATCRFYSAVVIKASLLHLFFTNHGRRIGASSRFKTWSLVFWCLLRNSRLFNDQPRQISITIVDLVLTPWLHIIFAHVRKDLKRSL